jgi:hypothetical protein
MWVVFAEVLCHQTSIKIMCSPLSDYQIQVGTHSRSAAKWLSRLTAGEAFRSESEDTVLVSSDKVLSYCYAPLMMSSIIQTIVCLIVMKETNESFLGFVNLPF